VGFFYEENLCFLGILFLGDKVIETIYKDGKEPVEKVKAVTSTYCNRCLGTNIYRCNYGKYHCLDCYMYGEINDTMTIYRSRRKLTKINHLLNLTLRLSDLQEGGADFLLDCYSHKESAFLQAVCGAGKTEMTYSTILSALNNQERVCFVIPRVEVLKEISVRLRNAFPKTHISVLYEGNKNYEDAQLILSTPQQLIHFYREFDLIIFDEVDAFPYSGNMLLERLVKKSLKKTGITIYMSATISNEFKNTLKNIRTFLIPSRHHKNLMVIPKFIKIGSKKALLKKLKIYLDVNRLGAKNTLVFVPTIADGILLKNKLLELEYKVSFVSSKTNYRKEVINQFRRGDLNFLITTTILERGVTFSNIDVFVIYADHNVFSKESLIQISGRVGRDILYPKGLLLFFSEYLSKEMKQTKNELLYMNVRNKEIEMQNL
jgi:competence protein ComFA